MMSLPDRGVSGWLATWPITIALVLAALGVLILAAALFGHLPEFAKGALVATAVIIFVQVVSRRN